MVSWSSGVLAEEANGSGGQVVRIPDEKIAPEVKELFPMKEVEPDLSVSFHRNLIGNQSGIAINYSFREIRYGLFIGATNLDIPPGLVRNLRKYRDGVFVFNDW